MAQIIIAIAFGLLTLATCQRTYQRSCDCEYMEDGKCAYTLLLPAGGGDSNGVCDSSPSEDIQGQIESLEGRLSTAEDNTGVQASSILRLTNRLDNFDEVLKSQGAQCIPCKECKPCDVLDSLGSLKLQTGDLSQQIMSIMQDMEDVSVTLRDFQGDVEERVTQTEEKVDSINVCECCQEKGILVSGQMSFIPDSNITASSAYNESFGSQNSRLSQANRMNATALSGAWCPGNDRFSPLLIRGLMCKDTSLILTGQSQTSTLVNHCIAQSFTLYYIFFFVVSTAEPNGEEWLQFSFSQTMEIYGVVTKGRSDYTQWVTSYSVQYQMETDVWMDFTNILGETEVRMTAKYHIIKHLMIIWEERWAGFV